MSIFLIISNCPGVWVCNLVSSDFQYKLYNSLVHVVELDYKLDLTEFVSASSEVILMTENAPQTFPSWA